MSAVVPARFLFRWSWPVRRNDQLPHAGGQLLRLDESFRCTPLSEIDGGPLFAELRVAWNPGGLGFSAEIRGKQEPLVCHPLEFAMSDGVTLWLDTRSTQTVHRATRYCHQFCLLPAGSGKKRDQPWASRVALGPGADGQPAASAKGTATVRVWSELRDDGYLLEAWFPAESLVGFDSETHRQLGFYVIVRDAELGEQFLTVGRGFPFEHDPSLWQLLELCD